MGVRVNHPVYDGTTGRGGHGGRRTHIIRLLRDAREPLTVDQVAKRVDLPVNTVRTHLEALVDAGMAVRATQTRSTPGRPKVAYRGVLPNQTHERAHGFRLLSEILAASITMANPECTEWMYQVGAEWGRCLMSRAPHVAPEDEDEIVERLIDKLDALWFAPELSPDAPAILCLYNCPFGDSTKRHPETVCQLHAGMINGALEEMGSSFRMVYLRAHQPGHRCEGQLGRTTARAKKVPLEYPTRNPKSGSNPSSKPA
ncbi:MAG: helix-turn-helix domain-containing protein [Propionibacteriaceae bacterium]|jgi:predicted ArsR family transcriptional regulator|nr:helix-turn-helix domain-containing protein [Propionibacteriaceae bacterium]